MVGRNGGNGLDGALGAARPGVQGGVDPTDPHGETQATDSPLADPHGETVATPSGVDLANLDASTQSYSPGNKDLAGEILAGRYVLEEKVGQGGMGVVYRAKHIEIGKQVAIKILLEKYAEKDQVVARLRQEARLASSVGNEHIIDITDIGQTDDGRTFVVMEYLEGMSLGHCIDQGGPLERDRAIRIARQVASALKAAHDKGVVHRDIKPENIFLLQRKGHDFVKVVDFGISKAMSDDPTGNSPRLTQTGMVLGTPLYMSPEQARGDEGLDHRIDVYAVGVIMYEMMTGDVPHRGSNYLNVLSQIVNNEIVSPSSQRDDLDADFEAVILKAMAKDRDERYQSMEELDEDLRILLGDDPTLSSSGMRVSAFRWHRKKNRSKLHVLWYAAGVALLLSAIAVTVSLLMPADTATQNALAAAIADAAPPPPPPRPDAAMPAQVEDMVTVHIESDPSGAKIYSDGGARYRGPAPIDIEFLKINKDIAIVGELEGYDKATLEFNPLVDKKVVVRLRKTVGPKRRPQPAAPGTNGKNMNSRKGSDDTAGGDLTGNPFDD